MLLRSTSLWTLRHSDNKHPQGSGHDFLLHIFRIKTCYRVTTRKKQNYYNTRFLIVCLELFLHREKLVPQLKRKYHSLKQNFENTTLF